MEGEGRVRGLFGREERCSEREREREVGESGVVVGGGGQLSPAPVTQKALS